jgi:simple sugar transport system permease protein
MKEKINVKHLGVKIKDIFVAPFKNISFIASLLSIFAGILVGFVIMLIVDAPYALGALSAVLFGGLNNGMSSIGDVLIVAAPLMLAGLSVGFAFKTGLFNIGVSGQMAFAAILAIYVGVKWTFLGDVQWIVAVIAAILGGALWGFIPGLLKALFNVHEVVATIMMNWIAIHGAFIAYNMLKLVGGTTQNAQKVTRSGALPSWGLDQIFNNSRINIGIILAIIAAIVIHIVLNKTTFGFELKAVGLNHHSAKYAGINSKRNIILSMTIAGALAGLAAATLYLNVTGATYRIELKPIAQGFEGIAVALLAYSGPLPIIASGIFFAWLKIGGEQLQSWGFDPNVIGIIMSAIVYFSALSFIFRKVVRKVFKKQFGGDLE